MRSLSEDHVTPSHSVPKRALRIDDETTYDAACEQIARLAHRDLHEQNLTPTEKRLLMDLTDAVSFYEDEPGVYERFVERVRQRLAPARAD